MTNEELLEVIEQAARDRLTSLDFSYEEIDSIPKEIGQLTKLVYLSIGENYITTLPPEIRGLISLRELHVNNNQLTFLPPEIGELSELRELHIDNNQLIYLPPEIGNLSNLRELHTDNNKIISLPPEIGKLKSLEVLHVNDNQLACLPSEIEKLIRLKELYIDGNQLTFLPLEIIRIENLQELYIGNNQLKFLPPEISQFKKLHSLHVNNNQLMSCPPEIEDISNLFSLDLDGNRLSEFSLKRKKPSGLYWLDVSNNQLTHLMLETGGFTNLHELNISNNQLTSLPPEIGKLSRLQELNISNNQLTSLPSEIGKLSRLRRLDLRDNQLVRLPQQFGLLKITKLTFGNNPWQALPPEIRRGGVKAILNFCRQQLEQETDQIYEAKLLIIGEGGAGKTTLTKKIQFSEYQLKEEDSTQGIDVIKWQFPLGNGKDFRVNIWDFGGQEIYHTTHQFFLTKRSLYALVVDTRKEDTDFYYWLNIVELLSDNSPLLIIKNEKQERQREINERQLHSEFTNLKETLSTNLATKRGLPEILTKIQQYISNLPHVGTELPKTWVKVREALEKESRSHISLDEYLKICEENGFTRREDKLQLSEYLHDLGVCLHFQDDDLLIKTVILNPTWGTDAVYKVLDNQQVIKNQGRFTRDDLKNIWHEDKYTTMQAELLRLMMNFKLCYEIPNSPKTYIASQLLTPNQPDYYWDDSDNLFLRYEYEFMPKGILTRFIVEMHAWIEEQSCVWKSGVVLDKDDAKAEVTERYRYHKGEIRIRVSGNGKRDLLTTIRHELGKIHDSYNSLEDQLDKIQRLKYQTLVPCNCPTCKPSQTPYFYPLSNLHNFKNKSIPETQCQISGDMVKVNSLIDDVDSGKVQTKNSPKPYLEDLKKPHLSEWNTRIKKLELMRSKLAMETDPSILFKLGKDIETEEEKIASLGNQLDEMP